MKNYRTPMTKGETWICPDCGYKYVSPLPVKAVSHDCPERRTKLPPSRGHGSTFKKKEAK